MIKIPWLVTSGISFPPITGALPSPLPGTPPLPGTHHTVPSTICCPNLRLQRQFSNVSGRRSKLEPSEQRPLRLPDVFTHYELPLLPALFTPPLLHHFGLTYFFCLFLLQDPKYLPPPPRGPLYTHWQVIFCQPPVPITMLYV